MSQQQMLVGFGPTGFRLSMTGPEGPVDVMLGAGSAGPVLSVLGPFNTITAGAAGSGRLVDIPTAEFLALPNGTLAWVASVQAYFYRLTSPTAISSDSITVLKPLGGVSREVWVRLPGSTAYWLGRSVYFVDAAAGSDENLGTTAGAALASYDELARRLSGTVTGGDINPLADMTITQVGNYAGKAALFFNVASGANVQVNGQLPVASFTGVISAKTDVARGTTGVPGTYADATSTWVPATELGNLVHDITTDRYSFIGADGTLGRAIMCPWSSWTAAGTVVPTFGASAVNDAVETFVLPTLGDLALTVTGGDKITGNNVPNGKVTVNNLRVLGTNALTKLCALGAYVFIQNSVIELAPSPVGLFQGGIIFLNNAQIHGAGNAVISSDELPTIAFLNGGLFRDCGTLTVTRLSAVTLAGDTLVQNTKFLATQKCLFTISAAGFRGCATPIQVAADATLRVQSAMWQGAASGNTGTGVALNGGSKIVYSNGAVFNVTGANDLTLAGGLTAYAFDAAAGVNLAPARNATWVLLQTATGGGGFGDRLVDQATGCVVCKDV